VFPVQADNVRLRVSSLRWSLLPEHDKDLLANGTRGIARVRKEIADSAKVRSMPPVEVVGEIWLYDNKIIHGRTTPLTMDNETWIGVQLSAQVAVHPEMSLVRAILVHEFAHCFYFLTRFVLAPDFGGKRSVSLPNPDDYLENPSHDRGMMVNPNEWFSTHDANTLVHWGDSELASLDRTILDFDLHKKLPVADPPLKFALQGEELAIPSDIAVHIRQLKV
jgi:hypothetical protein